MLTVKVVIVTIANLNQIATNLNQITVSSTVNFMET